MHNPKLTAPIRIVIADDHAIYRHGLTSVISGIPFFNVIGQASNGQELVELVDQMHPDIVITDIEMPVMNGISATSAVMENHPKTGVIALSIFDNEQTIMKMLQVGAKGYLLKNSDLGEITTAIERVTQNDMYISSVVCSKLTQLFRQPAHGSVNISTPLFTDKEISVIKLVCRQYLTKEIADELNTSIRAVESAKERIQHKIGTRNMIGIVVYALKNGIVMINEL